VCIYTGNKLAKFHGNILSLSENIAKSFRGATSLTHTVYNIRNCYIVTVNLEVEGMAEAVEGTVELEAEEEGTTAVAAAAALDQHTAAAAAVADTDN